MKLRRLLACAAVASTVCLAAATTSAVPAVASKTLAYSPAADLNSMYSTTLKYGAQAYWKAGFTGKGVDVALIDSGVAPVDGLSATGKLINGPDLSFESQWPAFAHLDTYGHGTHMAGIIAGRDSEVVPGSTYAGDSSHFYGVAPDARVVSVKVADSHGATDVSQIVAGIDWVVQHQHDNGLNIRVLNLSFGTDSSQAYGSDALAFAAEQAWNNGIVVVAAVGNQGSASKLTGLTDPAFDPNLLAVGATAQTDSVITDDTVAAFSGIAVGSRRPDLVAPGSHIASLRDPGSYADQTFGSTATVPAGGRFFRGSGSSQATAWMSGAAALVVQQHPDWSPDQVKDALMGNADPLPLASASAEGKGVVDLTSLLTGHPPISVSSAAAASGTGTLEGSRGDLHLTQNGIVLSGEMDIFGMPVSAPALATQEAALTAWSGGTFNGSIWSGMSWSGLSWSGALWTGVSWAGMSWSGMSWSSNTWSGMSWSGMSWSGMSWSTSTWSSAGWSDNGWTTANWN